MYLGVAPLFRQGSQGPAEQFFVVAPAIHVGAVEKGDAAIERMMDDADRLGIVALAIGAGERHAAQPDGEDGELAVAEGAGLGVRDGGHGYLLAASIEDHPGRFRANARCRLARNLLIRR